MKLLIEPCSKNNLHLDDVDGVILPIEDYSVESFCYFNLDEIIRIKNNSHVEVFVKINKNLFNDDIDNVREILSKLNDAKINGVFFYDIAILELKRELNLELPLVWNQTHMVNNYKTCDYYYSKGVQYALLGKEITLEEITSIIHKSKITSMVEVISRPSVAFSYRKLVSNYYANLGVNGGNEIKIKEKITDTYYDVIEDKNGSTFYLDIITNGTSIIKDLYEMGCNYIIFRESGIDNFNELAIDTREYIRNGCIDDNYIEKYKKLGDSTNFFFRKTIYKVK